MIRFLHLTLCNSLHCLLQFHCSTPHILNLHSFYLLHYSFFIHLFSLQLFFLLLSTFCIANKNVKYCLTPSFWLPHLLQSLPCYQTVCLCEQFIFSPFSFKPIYLQKVIWHLSEFIFISRTVGLLWLLISAQFSFQFHLTSLTSFSLNFFFFFCSTRQEKRMGILLLSSTTLTLWEIWARKLCKYIGEYRKIYFFTAFSKEKTCC